MKIHHSVVLIIIRNLLCAYATIGTILNFTVIGFAVFMEGFKRNVQKRFLYVGNAGGKHAHFLGKSFFCFCLSFN